MHCHPITRRFGIETTTSLCSSNDILRTKRTQKERYGADEDTRKLIIKVARRLFSQFCFHKTTIADIAHEMHMSSANVYRFFASKMDINEAVCADILAEIESGAKQIAVSGTTARQRLDSLLKFVEAKYSEQYLRNRNLHALIEEAVTEDWGTIQRHYLEMTASLRHIIAHGMESGEFLPRDSYLMARFVFTACSPFFDPRHAGEKSHRHDLHIDQMISFCATALKLKS
jgi:AcrR family transcriptional regulator